MSQQEEDERPEDLPALRRRSPTSRQAAKFYATAARQRGQAPRRGARHYFDCGGESYLASVLDVSTGVARLPVPGPKSLYSPQCGRRNLSSPLAAR